MSMPTTDSGEGIFLHPDALPCLKRSQLQSLCGRLGLKATGKNTELIERLLAFANETNTAEGPTQGRFVVLRPTKPLRDGAEIDSAPSDASLSRSSSSSSAMGSASTIADSAVSRSQTRSSVRTMRSTRSRAKLIGEETHDSLTSDASMSSLALSSADTQVIEQPVRRSARSRKTLAQLEAPARAAGPETPKWDSPALLAESQLETSEATAKAVALEEEEDDDNEEQQLTPVATPRVSERKALQRGTLSQMILSPRSEIPPSPLSRTSSTAKLATAARLSSTPRAPTTPRLTQTPRTAASPWALASPRASTSARSLASPRVSATPRLGQTPSTARLVTPQQSSTPARSSRLTDRTPMHPSPASHLADREPWEHIGGEATSPANTLGHTDYHLQAQGEGEEQETPALPTPSRPAMTRDHTMSMSEFGIGGTQSSLKSRGGTSSMSKSSSLRSISSSVHELGRGIVEAAKRAGAGGKRKREEERDESESHARDSVLISTNDDGDISMHTTCDEDEEVAESAPVETPRPIRGRPSRAQPSRAVLSPEPTSSIYPALPEPMAASVYPALPTPVSPPTVSSQGFADAANRVLAEMNARLAAAGRDAVVQLPTANAWSVSGSTSAQAGSIRNRMAPGPVSRFDGAHSKHFGQMDSIANHYAAKRGVPVSASSQVTAAPTTKRFKVETKDAAEGGSTAGVRSGVRSVSGTTSATKTAKEQEVIRRKLQVARARRRSLGGPKSARKSSGLAQRVGGRIAQAVGRAVEGVRRAMPSGSAASAPAPAQTQDGKKASTAHKAAGLVAKPTWGANAASSRVVSGASGAPSQAASLARPHSMTPSALSPSTSKPSTSVIRPISHPAKLGSGTVAAPPRSSSKVLSPTAASSAHERQLAKKRAVMGLSPKVGASSRPGAARSIASPIMTSPAAGASNLPALQTLVSPTTKPPSLTATSARKTRSSMGPSARGSASLVAGSTIASRKRAEIIRASREAQAQQAKTSSGLLSPSASTMRTGGQLRRKPANAALAATAAAQAQARARAAAAAKPTSTSPSAPKPDSPIRRLQTSPARKLASAGRGKGGFRPASDSERENLAAHEEERGPHDSASFEDLASTILYGVV